ncbi:MAG: D-glycerate dehydrogenase [Gammaproteobacteria bacterium]|nr:D-glycerate dehydrogenase [Gammaproteobacteria bacterium]
MIDDKRRIIITRKWPTQVEEKMASLGHLQTNDLDQPLSRDELAFALQNATILCPTVTDKLDAELLLNASVQTKLIANFGVGFNHIDIAAANSAGIAVANTPGVLTEATAELALTLLLMSARRAAEGERLVRSGNWTGWRPTHMLSTAVTGKTIGIIGLGRIGTALAQRCHHGFGMRILYCNRSPVDESVVDDLQAKQVDMHELLATSDFVSLNCPATVQTHHLIDADALRQMQPHAHLINTARGDIIDEAALVAALSSAEIAGAGLDVYEQEPNLANGLVSLQNVVLLPHMGSGTLETRRAMGMRVVANVTAFLQGVPIPDIVTVSNAAAK